MSLLNPFSKDWGENKSLLDRGYMWLMAAFVVSMTIIWPFYIYDWFHRTTRFKQILFIGCIAALALFGEDLKLLMLVMEENLPSFLYNLIMYALGLVIMYYYFKLCWNATNFFFRWLRDRRLKKQKDGD